MIFNARPVSDIEKCGEWIKPPLIDFAIAPAVLRGVSIAESRRLLPFQKALDQTTIGPTAARKI